MKMAWISAPPEEANGLARRVVDSGLAACVNVVYGVTSIYRWHGEIQSDGETLLIAKVADENADEFVARIREWHTYQCPEVLLTDVIGGNPDYIRWVSNPDEGRD
jgi:periplasmic divalent cation tolerance protein